MKQLLTLPLIAACAIVCSCKEAKMKAETLGDVTFARTTFESLAKGNQSVSADIDWKTLRFLGKDVGVTYGTMASAEDQARFRESFITQFSSEFVNAGGKVEDFGQWKVVEHDATHTVVTAATPNKVLKITVNDRDGKERVSGVDIAAP